MYTYDLDRYQVHRKNRRRVSRRQRSVAHVDTPLTVLLADPSHSARLVFAGAFRQRGHDTVQAVDIEQALTVLRDQPFDVVVIDVLMSGVQGERLLDLVRSAAGNAIIVAVSTMRAGHNIVRALREGADYYLDRADTTPWDIVSTAEILHSQRLAERQAEQQMSTA